MSRTIHADVITELAKDGQRFANLLEIVFFGGTVRITDYAHDIEYNSNTYTASGSFIGLSSVQESSDLRVGDLTLEVSGVDQTYLGIILNEPIIDRQLNLSRIWLNSSNAIIGDPVQIFPDGRISDWSLRDTGTTATVIIKAASHWADFDKRAGRYTNHNSQQIYYPGDFGFIYAPASTKGYVWGGGKDQNRAVNASLYSIRRRAV